MIFNSTTTLIIGNLQRVIGTVSFCTGNRSVLRLRNIHGDVVNSLIKP